MTENQKEPSKGMTQQEQAAWIKTNDGYEGWSLEECRRKFQDKHGKGQGKGFRKQAYYIATGNEDTSGGDIAKALSDAKSSIKKAEEAYKAQKAQDLGSMSQHELLKLMGKVQKALTKRMGSEEAEESEDGAESQS